MKVYRIIPDQVGRNYDIQAIVEDALYKLGYIGVSEHEPYFMMESRFDRAYNQLYDNGIKGVFFFKNPWDAVFCSWWVNHDFYSRGLVRVCEYDIPDEIIKKSTQGIGLYKGHEVEEIKVPISVLEETGIVVPTITEELSDQIEKEKKKILLESAEIYRKHDSEYADAIIEYLKDEYHELHEADMKAIEFLVKSPFVTGNMFPVTKDNRNYFDATVDIDYLINNSCGILTRENLCNWPAWFRNTVDLENHQKHEK